MDPTFWLKMSLNCRLLEASLGERQECLCACFAFENILRHPLRSSAAEQGWSDTGWQWPRTPVTPVLSKVTLESFCAIHLFLREGRA